MKNENKEFKNFIKEYNDNIVNYEIKSNIKEAQKNIEILKKELENLNNTSTPININFYGCAFNFANESTADSKYINGSDVYNSVPNKFDE